MSKRNMESNGGGASGVGYTPCACPATLRLDVGGYLAALKELNAEADALLKKTARLAAITREAGRGEPHGMNITDDMLRKCAKVMVGHLEDANRYTRKRMTDKKQLALAAYQGMREALEALDIRVLRVVPECYCTAVEIGDLRFPVREEG